MPRLNLCRAFVQALAALFTSGAVAEAQDLGAIPPNARVRVDFPAPARSRLARIAIGGSDAQSVMGTVEAVRADTLFLVVQSSDVAIHIPRGAIRSVYVSRGRPPRWRAAIDGAVLPALVTAALSAAGASIHRKAGDPTPAQMAVSSALWVGGSGAVLSAWHPKERWRPLVKPTPAGR